MFFRPPRCSFCGRSHAEVSKLVSGPGVYICDACVARAQHVIDTTDPAPLSASAGVERHPSASGLKRLLERLFPRWRHHAVVTGSA